MNLLKSSIQNELDSFFKAVSGCDVADRKVTDSAFCQARKKLSHSTFIELMHKGVEFFTGHFSPKTWHGFRLLAVDGSTIKVPRTKEVSDYFGAWNPARGKRCPVASYGISHTGIKKDVHTAWITNHPFKTQADPH